MDRIRNFLNKFKFMILIMINDFIPAKIILLLNSDSYLHMYIQYNIK